MQQGPFAPRALPRFNANTDPAATVSSSIDFPAVLPFDNLDGADALELVAANVTVAITEELAALGVLNVVPRADVLEYKGLAGGAREIAEVLGVGLRSRRERGARRDQRAVATAGVFSSCLGINLVSGPTSTSTATKRPSGSPPSSLGLAAASRLTVLENTLQKMDDRCADWDFSRIFGGCGAVF